MPLLLPTSVLAAISMSAPGVVISELQTGSSVSASEEFVELHNSSYEAFDVTGWRLEYKSASGSSWQLKATLNGVLNAGGYYLLAPHSFSVQTPTKTFAAGLARTGGQVRLVQVADDGHEAVIDVLGWGTSSGFETTAAPAPDDGQSLERKAASSGLKIDTNNNFDDFILNFSPNPQIANEDSIAPLPEDVSIEPETELETLPEPALEQSPPAEDLEAEDYGNPEDEVPVPNSKEPAPEEGAPAEQAPSEQSDQGSVASPSTEAVPGELKITELLPDPAAPLRDEDDEFIEILNTTDRPVSLAGYKLQTGLNFTYSYVFPAVEIAPQAYMTVYSKDSRLILSNSGGRARLVTSSGVILSETGMYGQSAPDYSWALVEEVWQWTSVVTANNQNQPSPLPVPEVPAPGEEPGPSIDKTIYEEDLVLPDQAPLTAEQIVTSLDTAVPNLLITELLPNPTAPVPDAEGEFIELYNASAEVINLKGYILQAGANFTYSYVLPAHTILPGGYLVLYSDDTKLTLSNASGRARLLDPIKTVLSETALYDKATEGQSWNLVNGLWSWSSQPTPGAVNAIVTPPAKPASNKTATKKAATTRSSSKSSAASTKKAAGKTTERNVYESPEETEVKTPIHYGVLAVVGVLTLVYAAYEYRKDFANRLFQLRRYLAYRRTNRTQPEGL